MKAHFLALAGLLTLSGCASLQNSTIEKVGDRQIEFALNGKGNLPVVFENGLGANMAWWEQVIPEVAKHFQTFAYNRPGYGHSAPVATPRDGAHIVEELRALLRAKGLHPPYILVGHSVGGLYMQWFARRYPEEVAGLVLVDSTHPAQQKGMGSPENWPGWLKLVMGVATTSVAKEELNAVDATGDAVLALPALVEKPVVVLSASQPLQEKSALADHANALRRDVARLYPGSRQVWIDSGHAIPLEKPESIISAIREVASR